MKTNTILAALLVAVALFTFGCKQQAATQLAAQQGEWVEITDTLSLPEIPQLTESFSKWNIFDGYIISDTTEYQKLGKLFDTTTFLQKHPQDTFTLVPPSTDLSVYSMVGILYFGGYDIIGRTMYVNDSLKKYKYSIRSVSDSNTVLLQRMMRNQFWFRVPKLQPDYTIEYDTTGLRYAWKGK